MRRPYIHRSSARGIDPDEIQPTANAGASRMIVFNLSRPSLKPQQQIQYFTH
jgi:hypothetical protein